MKKLIERLVTVIIITAIGIIDRLGLLFKGKKG